MNDASLLLRNVKGSFKVQKEEIDKTETKLIKEIQMLLVNDKAQWSQTKAQIVYRLHKLRSVGEVSDFAEAINNLTQKIETEKVERKKDD
jgi:ribosome-associated translation inhibitor RaiA